MLTSSFVLASFAVGFAAGVSLCIRYINRMQLRCAAVEAVVVATAACFGYLIALP